MPWSDKGNYTVQVYCMDIYFNISNFIYWLLLNLTMPIGTNIYKVIKLLARQIFHWQLKAFQLFRTTCKFFLLGRLGGLESKVDIVVATPGRLVDHINKTPGFSLAELRFLVRTGQVKEGQEGGGVCLKVRVTLYITYTWHFFKRALKSDWFISSRVQMHY